MEKYIPILITLIAAFVGVYGDLWTKDQDGDKKKLSTKGKAVLWIAVISFIFSISQQYEIERKLSRVEEIKKNILILEKQNLHDGIGECATSLYSFGKPTNSIDTIIYYDQLNNQVKIDTLKTTVFWQRIRSKNLINHYSTAMTYRRYLNERFSKAKELFENALNRNKEYFNIETIEAINELLSDPVFNAVIYKIDNNNSPTNEEPNIAINTPLWVVIGIHSYPNFIERINKLQIILNEGNI